MGPAGITLLMLVACSGFAWLAWRKLHIVLALGPEARRDEPLQRLRSVLVNGLLQRRMIRGEWRPGVMHAVIFVGFMSLLVRKLQLIAIGYDETAALPGPSAALFAAFKDVVELAVLLAVRYAFYRRFVHSRARLERNREALVVLSLISAIMVTDLAFDGFRFALLSDSDPAIAHERSFAFVGAALAVAFAGLPDLHARGRLRSSRTGCRWCWCSRSSCSCRWASTSTS